MEKEKEKERENEVVYVKDERRDRALALLKWCPKERVCEVEKVKKGIVLYPRWGSIASRRWNSQRGENLMRKVKVAFALTVGMLLLASAGAHATCPTYSFVLSYSTADVPAQSGTLTDGSGNAWTYTVPDFAPATGHSVAVNLTPATCSTGSGNAFTNVFAFSSAGLSPDSGFNGCAEGAVIGTWNAAGNSSQRWVWDSGSHLLASPCGTSGIKDNNGTAVTSANPDVLLLTAAGTYPNFGFTIKSNVTGRFLGLNGTSTGAPGALTFSTTQTVWTTAATHN